jgi:hypothetical protein
MPTAGRRGDSEEREKLKKNKRRRKNFKRKGLL